MIGEQSRIGEIAPADVVGQLREVWSFIKGREPIRQENNDDITTASHVTGIRYTDLFYNVLTG